MSTAKKKLPLARATELADALVADLEPGCQQIAVAGSIRRRVHEIGDIEIVCVPIPRHNLIGEPCGWEIGPILMRLEENGHLRRIKGGMKYVQFELPAHGINLDLFVVTTETWGIQVLIRTGSADYSRRFVTQRSKGGMLPDDLHVAEGRLWRGKVSLPTPEEADVFRLAGLEWIEPWERK